MLELATCFILIFVSTTFSFDDTIHPKIRDEMMKNPHIYANLDNKDWPSTILALVIFFSVIGVMLRVLFWCFRPRGENAPRAPRRRVRRRGNGNEEIPLEELRPAAVRQEEPAGNVNPQIVVEEAE